MLRWKERTSPEELCHDLHPAFAHFLGLCRSQAFDARPDYEGLRHVLREGISGPVNFEAPRVRQAFKQELQRAYFNHLSAVELRRRPPTCGFAGTTPAAALRSVIPMFVSHESRRLESQDVRRDSTRLIAHRAPCAVDLNDARNFFFEGYAEPLVGTVHVIVGPSHFFGFLRREHLVRAHEQAGQLPGNVEQVFVFSLSRRDRVARAVDLPDYDAASGKPYREWNLRSAFWARVTLVA
eukprot:NODE_8005_length_1531_cov_2.992877.p1 GENE.NODE_8005_length_1531_cov_2.992877~~NODE_8005_length_1531_cov_2.992877.p1  ORF type:complete len:238 (-),score=63.57 NODE_8005_length_1531_cov_2.992877:95-808(-)